MVEIEKIRVIFEAGPLITSCKFQVGERPIIDFVLDYCEVMITPSVKREVIDEGFRYPDAVLAGQRVKQGKIVVEGPLSVWDTVLRAYKLGDGEIESIRLFQESRGGVDYLVIDDNLAYIVSDRMGLRKVFFLDLILELVKRSRLDGDTAREMIEEVRPRYSEGFIEHSLEILEIREEGKHANPKDKGQ